MSEDLSKSLTDYEEAFLKIFTIYKSLGLPENIEDALAELNLLIEIVKAHHNYLFLKKQQWEKRLGGSS